MKTASLDRLNETLADSAGQYEVTIRREDLHAVLHARWVLETKLQDLVDNVFGIASRAKDTAKAFDLKTSQ